MHPFPPAISNQSQKCSGATVLLADKEGRQVFLSLSPGQYFIRPMMKEYEFTPVSKMAEIEEGAALDVTVT